MKTYDIAVIGAGPAGCMAAISGAQLGKNTVLLERNNKIGRKLLLTAHGKCNLTNMATMDVSWKNLERAVHFIRTHSTNFPTMI